MKFSVKSMLVAFALLFGATVVPGSSEARTVRIDGGVVSVRDHGDRFQHRRGDYRGPRDIRRGHMRYGDRVYGGGRRYYREDRFHRRHGNYYGDRHHARDRRYFDRRHHRDNGVVIRLR